MKKYLKPTVWIFTILAIVFLYFSLRSEEEQLVYSVIAFCFWGISFLANRYLKKTEQGEKEKET
ncbi:MAG: hypothetical protein AAF789_05985 [Bacteroidota bacterium]